MFWLIKKYFSVFLCVVLCFVLFSISSSAVSLGISASAAVVMVAQTGEVIYGYNTHKRLSMASTTKIMTSLIALENADLKKEITVKSDELNVEGTSMGLLAGDKVTFEGLIYGMLLQSGNDAANVAASRIGGSIDKFIDMMNSRARRIGMKNTNFATPSGLDDEEHYSTAYDMALLGSEAIKNPDFRFISSQKKATLCYGNPPYRRTLTNHNKMLTYYDGCIGLKTGFTKKSGRCLVTAAERDGVTLVAVTLNAPNDWNDHKILLDYGFSQVKSTDIEVENLSVDVVGGTKSDVSVTSENKFRLNMSVSCDDYEEDYLLNEFVYAPIKKGDSVGKVVYKVNNKQVGEVILVAGESVPVKKQKNVKKTFLIRIKDYFKSIFKN